MISFQQCWLVVLFVQSLLQVWACNLICGHLLWCVVYYVSVCNWRQKMLYYRPNQNWKGPYFLFVFVSGPWPERRWKPLHYRVITVLAKASTSNIPLSVPLGAQITSECYVTMNKASEKAFFLFNLNSLFGNIDFFS